MNSILGIDAAWTAGQPSGVALVARDGAGAWRCLSVAPSYGTFVRAAEGEAVPWAVRRLPREAPDVGGLLAAASRFLGGGIPDAVTIDMPVSRVPIVGRREADNAVSRAFGAAGCGTHSPTPSRPGALGAELTEAFGRAGYSVAAADEKPGTVHRLLEVYPHPALLGLMMAERRLEYKAGKSRKFWPASDVRERIGKLLDVYARILGALDAEIADIRLPLPAASTCPGLASLKRYEDTLDALVCAWVGCRYIDSHASAFGNTEAAIWVPDEQP